MTPQFDRQVRWRKSSRSASSGNGDCVEAAKGQEGFLVRDSKLGDESPVFELSASDFGALLNVDRRPEANG